MRGLNRLVSFGCVGATVAVIYVLLYLAFLSIGIPQIFANAFAFLIAVAVQYVGQAAFTFGKNLSNAHQMTRFAAMIGIGLVTSAVFTGIVGPILHMPEWVAAACVTVILPIQNYLIMTRWVFSTEMENSV